MRPISLLNAVCRIMDRLVAGRITERGEREGWFRPWQGGFRAGRGVCDQLVAFSHLVSDGWRRKKVCVTAFLDASKAYDRVHREGLIAKLINRGLGGRALRWIVDFLTNRNSRVKFDTATSRYREFRYGLPQGSCLSPILFNVFLSDVFEADHFEQDTDGGVYADDIRVSALGDTVEEASVKLSQMLLDVRLWGRKNRVRFDVDSDKCGYVVFSRKKQPDSYVCFGEHLLHRKEIHKCLGVYLDEGLYFSHHIAQVKAKSWRAYHDIRRVVGEGWGASTQVIVGLYEGLVRPVLEFACMVWDGAARTEKAKLERVHRLSLLAATGAKKTTSTQALEIYCNTDSPQDRRDYLSASFYHRIMRLDPQHHPVAELFRTWREAGSPCSGPSVSLFPRAAALCRRLSRFSTFSDGGLPFLEPIPSPPPKKVPSAGRKRPSRKDIAKRAHFALRSGLDRSETTIIYTDGSAAPNPGKIGLGASFEFNGKESTFGSPIGIGSILTAELAAIKFALVKLQNSINIAEIPNCKSAILFSDCQTALDLIAERCSATGNFELLSSIKAQIVEVRNSLRIELRWVPAHVGVRGNELANSAAKNAAYEVPGREPIPGQPPVSLATSKSLVKAAIRDRKQSRWLRKLAEKDGQQHLSRIRPDISRAAAHFVGRKTDQVILSRLRFGDCGLNASPSRLLPGVDETCLCGIGPETVKHFLLECNLHAPARQTMLQAVQSKYSGTINEDLLLGGSGVTLDEESWLFIGRAVAEFVRNTGRDV